MNNRGFPFGVLKGYVIDDKRTLVTNDNYINLVHRVDSLENRLVIIEENERFRLPLEKVIYEDTVFDALVIIDELIKQASETIVIIDPYSDLFTLNAIKNKNKGVVVTIYTSSKNRLSNIDIEKFNEEYQNLIVIIDDRYHDRYLIIDKVKYYHLGSSINYMGNKFSQISEVIDIDIIETLKNRI